MNGNSTNALVQEIMLDFARLTGLASTDAHQHHYEGGLCRDMFVDANSDKIFPVASVCICDIERPIVCALHLINMIL
jgi:hypothetical protein